MTARPRIAVALVLAAALLAACSSDDGPDGRASTPSTTAPRPTGSAGCDAATVVPPGSSDHTVTVDGEVRTYTLDVPTGYDGRHPFPLVLGLHALTVDQHVVLPMLAPVTPGDAPQFLGVAPSGRRDGGVPFWNAAGVADNYDVVFLERLLDDLERSLCVDTTRVFAAGMSNGAQMSSLLACRIPDRIAGIAPIAGVEFPAPCPGAPVPVIAFHGTDDPIVLYEGGGLNAVTIADNQHYRGDLPAGVPTPHGVEESMALWADHNGCDTEYDDRRVAPSVRLRSWPGCDAATELYIVEGAGHTWPGRPIPAFEVQFGPGTTEIDAGALLFTFLFEHAAAG